MSELKIDLAKYLFTRLKQLGVDSVHGVPGDYNLQALDYIEPAGISWVGNANELNAGYAADGYGRIKGVSALVTAFGVGELSCINAIGSAYAERSPVVHIVGTPSVKSQISKVCLHHSLGDGNFRVFAEMYAKVTCAQANLTDCSKAPETIDTVLRECILQSRPVYIELPVDMIAAQVCAKRLDSPIDLTLPHNDEGFEDAEVDLILNRIYAAKQPFIIIDGFTAALGVTEEADELVRVTGFPTSTTSFGKGIVNESYPNFHGIYAGSAGKQVYRPWVESCDLILRIGPLSSDVNTYGFTTIPHPQFTIEFHRNEVKLDKNSFQNVHVKPLLRKMLDRLDPARLPKYDPYPELGHPRTQLEELSTTQPADLLDQATFWQRMSAFFRSGDIIVTETGTPAIGGRDFVLPPQTTMINSGIWLSIGTMLGVAQGAALAQRDIIHKYGQGQYTSVDLLSSVEKMAITESRSGALDTNTKDDSSFRTKTDLHEDIHHCTIPPIKLPAPPSTRSSQTTFSGRTILFIGDGSFQMTAQSLSDTIRNRIPLIIILINNNGYTIERIIHGMKASYNDIQPWRYLQAAEFFGADLKSKDYPIWTGRADNYGELWLALDKISENTTGLNMLEVIMHQEDAPDCLKKLVDSTRKRNSASE